MSSKFAIATALLAGFLLHAMTVSYFLFVEKAETSYWVVLLIDMPFSSWLPGYGSTRTMPYVSIGFGWIGWGLVMTAFYGVARLYSGRKR